MAILMLSCILICVLILPALSAEAGSVCSPTPIEDMKALYTKLGLEIPDVNEGETSHCKWPGVTCDESGESDVISLDLSGQLVPNNPDGVTISVPQELACLTKLESLNLSDNNMHNTFPAVLYEMQSIKELAISNAGLYGTVPTHLCYLKNLEALDLSSNFLYGEIPECLTRPENLDRVNLKCNRLDGTVPRKIINSMPVVAMDLDCNPDLIFQENLGVSNDNSEETCGECPNESVLRGPCAYGPLEYCDGTLYTLTDPEVEACQLDLTGTIPDECLAEMEGYCEEQSEPVGFCERPMTEIVSSILNAFNSTDINVSEDTTMESICTEYPDLKCDSDYVPTAITIISRPGDSDITNTPFPQDLGCLKDLTELTISAKGNIFPFSLIICQLKHLQTLTIDSPGMYGRIPECIGDLIELQSIEILDSNLEGPLPDTIANLSELETLYIACMKNGGVIPLDIYALKNLNILIVNSSITPNSEAENLDEDLAKVTIEDSNEEVVCSGSSSNLLSETTLSIKGCGDYIFTADDSDANEINPETGMYYICENKAPYELLQAAYDQLGLSKWYEVQSSTNSTETQENTNTSNYTTDICMWKGVRCIGNEIILDLSNTKLTFLPDEITCLQNITSLILADNPLENVPENVCMLKDLEYLSLENTNITSVPECVYSLPNLSLLNICGDTLDTSSTQNENSSEEAEPDAEEGGTEEEDEEKEGPSSSQLEVLEGPCCRVRPQCPTSGQ